VNGKKGIQSKRNHTKGVFKFLKMATNNSKKMKQIKKKSKLPLLLRRGDHADTVGVHRVDHRRARRRLGAIAFARTQFPQDSLLKSRTIACIEVVRHRRYSDAWVDACKTLTCLTKGLKFHDPISGPVVAELKANLKYLKKMLANGDREMKRQKRLKNNQQRINSEIEALKMKLALSDAELDVAAALVAISRTRVVDPRLSIKLSFTEGRWRWCG
tara:strand:- start:850 stop:1494 length:645 start_codon:yes stop_codon:yes gene_type:complete